MSGPAGAATATRRNLLGVSVAGAALVLAGCGKQGAQQSTTSTLPAVADADITTLNQLLDLEYKAIAAYTAGTPLLDSSGQAAAKQFLTQELYHASRLYSLITAAGGMPDKQKPNYPLGRPRTREDVLRLLHELEHEQVSGYLAAIPRMTHKSVRLVLSTILSNDAQHIAVIRSELGLEPVTGAFVVGGE